MLSALLEQLIEKPELYQDEMAIFLYDEFDVLVTTPSISRALASAGWSKKLRAVLQRSETQTCKTLTSTIYQRSAHTTWFTLTSLDMTTGLGSGGLAGPPWE
jgi:hypothetical protein